MVTGALIVAVAVAAISWEGRERLLAQIDRYEIDSQNLVAQTAGAGDLNAAHAQAVAAIRGLGQEWQRFSALRGQGLPLERLLSEAVHSFRGRALLRSLRIDAEDTHSEVSMTGSTYPDPGRSLAALRSLTARLEASDSFAGVSLDPPTGIPGSGEAGGIGVAQLDFALSASLEASR